MRLTNRRSRFLALLLTLGAVLGLAAVPARASTHALALGPAGRNVGTCAFTALHITASLNNSLRPTTLSFNGSATCVVDGFLTTGVLQGSVSNGLGLSCSGGTASGTATLSISGPFPLKTGTTSLVVTGPTATLTLLSLSSIVAVGEFAQLGYAGCVVGGSQSQTWAGGLAIL